MKIPERESNGRLPAYAWPGGYSIVYVMADGAYLCAGCANNENGSDARTVPDPDAGTPDQWLIVGADVYWEGPDDQCAHCGGVIESEYGDPDED